MRLLLASLLLLARSAGAICGDVDGDGRITIGDALKIAQCAAGMISCTFPKATECINSTANSLDEFYAVAFPYTASDCPDTCAIIRWEQVCDPNSGPCPPEPVVRLDRSPNGYAAWTEILPASSQGQTYYIDQHLEPNTPYYYRASVVQ